MQSTQLRSPASEFCLSAIPSELDQKSRFQDREESHLQNLAQQAQSGFCTTQTEQRQAINKLLNALLNSGKLRGRGQYHTDIYDDAVNRTLCWIALHIAQFNPEQGCFLPWVNYRLDMMLRKAQSETLEPLVRSQYQKVIRRKYQLTAIAGQLAPTEERPCLSEMIKEYIESDPDMLCQNHIRNCPKATLKAILAARLEDKSWQEIAENFGLTVASVKNFFSRQMKTIAPLIKQHIQSEF